MNPVPDRIREELIEISPALANVSRQNVFVTPNGYFDTLAADIASFVEINMATPDVLPQITTTIPYSVPEGYFDTLAETILQKARMFEDERNEVYTELQDVAPLLNTINKQMPFIVPAGYFTSLRPSMTPVVAIKRQRPVSTVRSMYKYAVAAAIIGILAVGTYFFTNNNSNDVAVGSAVVNIQQEMRQVSDSEIATYLENNNFAVDTYTINNYNLGELPIDEYLKSVSDEEIRNYLKENVATKRESL